MNPSELATLKLLIRGFGVRVPGGAPVLAWCFFRFACIGHLSQLHSALRLRRIRPKRASDSAYGLAG